MFYVLFFVTSVVSLQIPLALLPSDWLSRAALLPSDWLSRAALLPSDWLSRAALLSSDWLSCAVSQSGSRRHRSHSKHCVGRAAVLVDGL